MARYSRYFLGITLGWATVVLPANAECEEQHSLVARVNGPSVRIHSQANPPEALVPADVTFANMEVRFDTSAFDALSIANEAHGVSEDSFMTYVALNRHPPTENPCCSSRNFMNTNWQLVPVGETSEFRIHMPDNFGGFLHVTACARGLSREEPHQPITASSRTIRLNVHDVTESDVDIELKDIQWTGRRVQITLTSTGPIDDVGNSFHVNLYDAESGLHLWHGTASIKPLFGSYGDIVITGYMPRINRGMEKQRLVASIEPAGQIIDNNTKNNTLTKTIGSESGRLYADDGRPRVVHVTSPSQLSDFNAERTDSFIGINFTARMQPRYKDKIELHLSDYSVLDTRIICSYYEPRLTGTSNTIRAWPPNTSRPIREFTVPFQRDEHYNCRVMESPRDQSVKVHFYLYVGSQLTQHEEFDWHIKRTGR